MARYEGKRRKGNVLCTTIQYVVESSEGRRLSSALLSPTVSGVEWAVERSLSPPFSPPLIAVAALPPSLSVLIDCVSGEKGGEGTLSILFYFGSVCTAFFAPDNRGKSQNGRSAEAFLRGDVLEEEAPASRKPGIPLFPWPSLSQNTLASKRGGREKLINVSS